jgi:hypothetical protein
LPSLEAVEVVEARVNRHEEVPDSIQIQQQQTHHPRWERTVRDTQETVAAVEPEAAEPLEVEVVREPLETQEVSEAILDQT